MRNGEAEQKGMIMRDEQTREIHNLNDQVLIKRWRATGTIVARSYSPLRYDIQCARKLHRDVPAGWVHPVTADNVIRLVA